MAKQLCIDVSEHNGTIDWAAVKKAGINYAIIRDGYGTSHVDNYFKRNMEGAIAQGIHIGIYHFSYALSAAGAKAEAEYVLKLIQPYKDKIVLPVFFDFEYDTVAYAKKQGVTLGKEAFNAHTVAFCDTIQAAGYRAGVYYNLDYLRRYVDIDRIGKYVQWYAQYSPNASATTWDFWQYSSSYTIAGCAGKFDVSVLKNSGSVTNSRKYTVGWHCDSKGRWYADSATSYYHDRWAKIDGKWYRFDSNGYALEDQWSVDNNGRCYYLGLDGAMLANMVVGLSDSGEMCPIEPYCHLLRDVPIGYRKELDKLIAAGKLKGKSGSGDDMVLDMPLSALRVLIILSR